MTVDAIKEAIAQLPEADRRNLADWFEEQVQHAWDLDMERDLSGKRGDDLFEEVNRQIDSGQFVPMDFESHGRRRH